jgi:hypothetical protein
VPVLAADEPRSIVGGALMQPWKLRGGEEPPRLDAAGLRAFAEPGWVKTGLDFTLQADGTGTRLSTETRSRPPTGAPASASASTGWPSAPGRA